MPGVLVVGFIYSFKNLKVLESLSINAVKHKILRNFCRFNLQFEADRIDSVFPRWSESLLSINHKFNLVSSSLSFCSISITFFPWIKRAEASANNKRSQSIANSISFTCIQTNTGPNIEP